MKRRSGSFHCKAILAVILLCVCCLRGSSQTKEEIKQLEEIGAKMRAAYKPVYNREEINHLHKEWLAIIARSKSFIAFTIGYEVIKADIRGLNADMEFKGFPLLKDRLGAIVFGYSRMNKRLAGNLLFNVVPGNNVSNGDYEISLRGSGASFDKGYAFVYSDNLIIHAFAGFGWQYSTVKETKITNASPGINLFDLPPGDKSTKVTRDIYHASLGMQVDLNASYRQSSNFGLQTGIRFSYNPMLGKGKYQYEENSGRYKPIIGWRKYNISFMLKLFSKTYFR